MLSPAFKGNEGNLALQFFADQGCTFLKDNLCELFGTGLQPLECRFCHHSRLGLGPECHAALEKDWHSPAGQKLVLQWNEITRAFERQGLILEAGTKEMTLSTLIKKPSAFLPIVMSLAALATLLFFLARFGVVHETDEGAAAHIWQLLMGLQLPVIAFFAIKWLPRTPQAGAGHIGAASRGRNRRNGTGLLAKT